MLGKGKLVSFKVVAPGESAMLQWKATYLRVYDQHVQLLMS